MLLKVARVLLSLVMLAGGGLVLDLVVHRPYQQNAQLRSLIHSTARPSPSVARRYQNQLAPLGPWDPYLEGFGEIAAARLAADANQFDTGLRHYEAAAAKRVPPSFWVEAGLYMMAHGRYDRGFHLVTEAMYVNPGLIQEVESEALRRQILRVLEKEELRVAP